MSQPPSPKEKAHKQTQYVKKSQQKDRMEKGESSKKQTGHHDGYQSMSQSVPPPPPTPLMSLPRRKGLMSLQLVLRMWSPPSPASKASPCSSQQDVPPPNKSTAPLETPILQEKKGEQGSFTTEPS